MHSCKLFGTTGLAGGFLYKQQKVRSLHRTYNLQVLKSSPNKFSPTHLNFHALKNLSQAIFQHFWNFYSLKNLLVFGNPNGTNRPTCARCPSHVSSSFSLATPPERL